MPISPNTTVIINSKGDVIGFPPTRRILVSSILASLRFHMPLISDLSIIVGTGPAVFTRASSAYFFDETTGLYVLVGNDQPRFETNGIFQEGKSVNLTQSPRDLSTGNYARLNLTATKTADGIEGAANNASVITATSANGTIFQTITGTATRVFSPFVKRRTGTGTVEMSADGGSTFVDITSNINNSNYVRQNLLVSSTNPSFGFRVVQASDAVDVDFFQVENNVSATSPIDSGFIREADELRVPISNMPAPTESHSVSATADTNGKIFPGFAQTIFDIDGEDTRTLLFRRVSDNDAFGQRGADIVIVENTESHTNPESISLAYVVDINNPSSGFTIFAGNKSLSGPVNDNVTGIGTSVLIGINQNDEGLYGHIKDLRIFAGPLTAEDVALL